MRVAGRTQEALVAKDGLKGFKLHRLLLFMIHPLRARRRLPLELAAI